MQVITKKIQESNWPDLCQHGEWLGDLSESLSVF